MAKVAICRSFLESYSMQTGNIQKQAREAVDQLIDDPQNGSLHVESINDAKDLRMRSARVTQAYRMIILRANQGDLYYLLWIDHHDEAYKWAQSHVITGQLLDDSLPLVQARAKAYTALRLFESCSDGDLLMIGVPFVMLSVIRQIENETQLDDLKEFMPPPLFEDLYGLARGHSATDLVQKRKEEKERIFNKQFQLLLDKEQWREVPTFTQPFSTGQIIRGKYVVEALVGRDVTGNRSAVYKVHDVDNVYTGNRAIKVFLQQDELASQCIANELEIRQHVVHENISHCFGADHLETTGEKFLILEYHEGNTLRQMLKQKEFRPITLIEIANIAEQTLNGLRRLHEAGYVHGQISLDSIVLDQKGCIKIVSFDSSGKPGPLYTCQATASSFAPPDLAQHGRHYGQDTYAFGKVLFEMVAGEMSDPMIPRLPSRFAKEVGSKWVNFIEKACQPKLQNRFNSAGAMLHELPGGSKR